MVDISKEKDPATNSQEMGGRQSVSEEKVAIESTRKPEDIAKDNLEVASWMEKIEKKFARVPNQTSDANDDTVVVQQDDTQQPPITISVTHAQMMTGKSAKPELGIAWLVAWAIRQIKIFSRQGKRVRLQDMPEAK